MFQHRLVVAFCVLAAAGCRCGAGPGTSGLAADFDPNPKSLSFEACPTQDENGAPVADVFPEERKFVLRNLGRATGTVVLSLTGPQADAFSLVPDRIPETLPGTQEAEIPVLFSPKAQGDARAQLVVDDGNANTEPVEIALVGTGRDLPAQPTLLVAPQNKDDTADFPACDDPLRPCEEVFPDTFYDQASTLTVKLRNKGCPALKVTGLEILPYPGAAATNLAFFIDQPAVPPTEQVPMQLSAADGTAETGVVVRFAPVDDGSGNERYAILRIHTNDPNLNPGDPSMEGVYEVTLYGSASQPAIYAQPPFCSFDDPSDPCGNATKVAGEARFEIKNGGNAAFTVDSVSMTASGQGRFNITQNVQGLTIQPASSQILVVQHVQQPVFITADLTLAASVAGISAGTATIRLSGGIPPCMTTDPEVLDFQNATQEFTDKQVTIRNGAACGTLVLNEVFVDPQPFFSVTNAPAQGTTIAPGAELQVTVRYKKPVSGGVQAGVLRIDSNDPDFAGPAFKVVSLYSESPLDQLPVAAIKGCLTSDATCASGVESSWNVRLQDLAGPPKQLMMWAKHSFDPGNSSPDAISGYLFRLVGKPTGANATLENDGVKSPNGSPLLTLDNLSVGLYRVTVVVYDNQNQPSPTPAELKVYVNP